VTPTSYLELLTTFLKLLDEKRTEVSKAKKRLVGGLDKLTNTAAQVRLRADLQMYSWGQCRCRIVYSIGECHAAGNTTKYTPGQHHRHGCCLACCRLR
jgi:hypothetical protein